ncbi:MAG: CAP domain-containing protein [Gemmataceae bacterium]|nr:CAP domain-containing protein [Gemmataceae bacterium]
MRFCLGLVLSLSLGSVAEEKSKATKFVLSEDEKGVLDWTNAQRKAAGLAELVANEKLTLVARAHSANMAKYSKLDHNLGGSVGDRVRAAGYGFSAAGENIAWNSSTPGETVKLWMNSSGHRANIMNGNYSEIGVAVAMNARGEPYWAQIFGKP